MPLPVSPDTIDRSTAWAGTTANIAPTASASAWKSFMAVDLPLELAAETARADSHQMPTQHLNAEYRFGFQHQPFGTNQRRAGY